MNLKRNLCLMAVLFIALSNVVVFAEIGPEVMEEIRNISNRHREFLQQNKSLTDNISVRSRDYAVSERIFQYVDWFTSEWVNEDKVVFGYDEHGRISILHYYEWNEQDEVWIPTSLTTHFIWDNDLLVNAIQRIEIGGQFFDFIILTQSFNNNDQITGMVVEMYDDFEDDYIIFLEFEFFYDNNGFAERLLMSDYDWDEYEQSYIFYDSHQRMSEIITEELLFDDDWFPYERSIFTYHTADQSGYQDFQNFLNTFAMMMILHEAPWLEEMMFESEYIYYWDFDHWELWERALYSYLPNNNIESVTWEDYWDGDWEYWDRTLYSYDDMDLLEEILYQDYYDNMWEDFARFLFTMEEISDVEDSYLKPISFNLTNYPNPFNPETTISFVLPVSEVLELTILNIKGQKVVTLIDEMKTAGSHRIVWDGKDTHGNSLTSGVYFYHLSGGNISETGKMLLLK